MHDTKNMGFLAWLLMRKYLCTKYASTSVCGYLVWVCLKCTMPKMWRPKRTYPCTKYIRTSVFEYLVWVCLKCTMPKNRGFWRGAPNAPTPAPNMPAPVFLDT